MHLVPGQASDQWRNLVPSVMLEKAGRCFEATQVWLWVPALPTGHFSTSGLIGRTRVGDSSYIPSRTPTAMTFT